MPEKRKLLDSYLELINKHQEITHWSGIYTDSHCEKKIFSSLGTNLRFDTQIAGLRPGIRFGTGKDVFSESWCKAEDGIDKLQKLHSEAKAHIEQAQEFFEKAEKIEGGNYCVVLSPLAAGIFAHESFGHKSEADFMIGDDSMKKEWSLGKKVGAEILNICDNGQISGSGFCPFDDEGTRAEKTRLICCGRLEGRLHSAQTAAELAEATTGNARSVGFEFEPIVIISNKVNMNSIEYSIENDGGPDLKFADTCLSVSFLLKEATSTGIMDTFFGITDRKLEESRIIQTVKEIIEAYQNKVELSDLHLPIIIDQSMLTRLFLRDLNGKLAGNNASLFQQQIGQKVFNENFTLKIANDPVETFSPEFDSEGTIAPAKLLNLVENGRIVRPYTDKRTALQYNFEYTGCAGGAYDSVPSPGTCNFEINHSNKTLKELLGGRHGILVAIASGGDFTSDGQFASPVQVAYLTDGENLLGRLPERTISGSIFDFFGENFIGVSSDKIYCAGNERLAVVKLDCKRL